MRKFLENLLLTETSGHTASPPPLPSDGARPPAIGSQADEWSLDAALLCLSNTSHPIKPLYAARMAKPLTNRRHVAKMSRFTPGFRRHQLTPAPYRT
jgi:hypothetical protein